MDPPESTFPISNYSNSNPRQIRLEDYIKDIYVSDFSTEWEENILKLIPSREKRIHSSFINSVLDEVKEMYVENMKDFVLKSILSCKMYKRKYVTCEECNIFASSKRRITDGKYTMYDRKIFLKHRNLLAERYFLSHPIIRHVINTAHRILPTVICDFERYRELGTLTLHDFRDIILKDIKRGTLMIANQFYTATFKAVQRSKCLKSVSAKRLPRFMRCLTNIFVQQILNAMMRSIDHVISIMKDGRFCPQIEFHLVCESDRLVTKPDVEEVLSTYHDIVNGIANIAQDLMPLEEWLGIKAKERYIKVLPPDWFIERSHCSLREILNVLFRPVNEHVAFVSAEFGDVCTSSIENRISSLTSERQDFDAYLAHIYKYNEYLSKTNSMLSNLYYSVGKLEQSSAKESLRQICHDVINVLTLELVEYHRDFNRSICSSFEDLKSTALNIPRDANSLIQLSEYMSRASKVLMKEQEQKIRRSIYMLSKLLDITVLTDEHVDLNKIAINWLHDIQPVFAQNNTLCEAMKSELEEDLQRRINSLNTEVDAMFPQLIILDDMDDINKIGEYAEYYEDLMKKYKRMDNEMRVINSEERLFKFPETEFPKIIELKETIVPFYTLIRTVYQWQRNNSVWLNGPFEYLNASVIEKKTVSYLNEITEMNKTMKARIKMDVTANKSYKFSGIADDPDPMQQPAPLKLCWQAFDNVNKFKVYLPLANCMCNPALCARHWKEMSAICNIDLTPNAGTTLKKMIDMNLMDNIDKYEAISLGANKELRLQQELTEMIEEWQPISFEMSTDTASGFVTFKYIDDIEALLGEHLIKIEEMRASYFVKPILSDLIDFSTVLARIQEILDEWAQVQFRKLDLQPIFSYPGMEMRLNQETSLYLEATTILLDVNNRFTANPSFQEIKRSSDLPRILNEANEKLERANKGSRNYLDVKRLSFARLFFLDDSEIQKVLFESIDTVTRNIFVKKCFAGIRRLKFNKFNRIREIIGYNGDTLRLNDIVSIDTKPEERWLIRLEGGMKDAVRESICQYHVSIDGDSTFVPNNNFPSMVIICGLHLYWTSSVEKCLRSLNIAMLNSLCVKYSDWIISLTNELRNNLTRRYRNLLMSSIVVTLAHKEIIRLLLDRGIIKQTDFEWIAQLKYHCNDNKVVEISVFDTTIEYGYEYNYCRRSFVNTPLTDRCFRTVLQAYRYNLYSGVVGPTCSGKTETIGSLTRALAKLFYVVNCNNRISYDRAMRIIKGVVSCGAWVCFENFDRLKLELLSAVAQNLTQMKQAISSNSKTISFERCDLNLNVSGYVCVNINSARSKYNDLPDNLKMLFRSVSMTAPDIGRIIEIELFAGGFLRAKLLATKLVVGYKLLSEHLGEKCHYNFNASSLKTVVAAAIDMKQNVPDENEHTLLLRSMIDINIPQLCTPDIPIFQSIMRDVFPESDVLPPFDCSAILQVLENVCAERFLISHTIFKLKIVQIIELMYVQRGLMLISDPLGGKTEILHALAETLSLLQARGNKIGATVKLETIMPEVVDSGALFGYFCDKSGIWKDGFCTSIFRRFAEDASTDRKWLVFDGALSGAWIENLYTILDKNEMLYLTSGERLPMTASMSVIFETTSITEISPSLVSRCGTIYIDSHSIGWRPHVLSHIRKHNIYNGHDKVLRALFDWAIDSCLEFLRENGDISVHRELHYVTSILNLFEILLRDACEDASEDTGKSNQFVIWAQAALMQAIAWGLGGNLIEDSQMRFNAFCTTLWSGADTKHPKPDAIKHLDITFPNEGLIQDNFYVFKGVGNWKYWGDLLKSEKIPEICNFNQIYIPSINSIKYNHMFLKHIKYRKHFLLYGDAGVGKSSIMYDLLRNKLSDNCFSNFFSFTSMLTVTRTQRLFLSKLNKIRRTVYSPGKNQFCVNFVDDVNRAVAQTPETRPVFELLRQLLSHGYCYDTNKFSKIFIQNVMFTFAITGKINENVSPRFLRYFNTYAIFNPTTDNIFKIYFNVLSANLKKNLFAADVTGSVTSIVNATIDVYKSVIKTLRPVPNKLHYCFDMRDISKVINGCGLIQKESVETKITFIRLWVHEILRVFGDRMLDVNDKEWLFLKIRDAVKSNFKDSYEIAFDYLPKYENNQITKDSFDDLIFGHFIDTEKSGKSKRYEEINSMEALKNRIIAYLDEYNANFTRKMDVVVCRYMLQSLIKISRVLSIPGGNVLAISTVGSGRKSTAALAAFIQQQSLFETTTESYYDPNAWRDGLRKVLRECGALRKDVTYFMNERQMKDAFLSDISCLLSTGELPDLFSAEDRQCIIETTRLHAQAGDRNAEISARLVMKYFVEQCKNRLHFVLCFSPTNTAFRTYLCSYPNLAKHCTVNCYQIWPDQALLEIAVKHMKDVNVQKEIKAPAVRACVHFHENAREMSLKYHERFSKIIHVTSSTFLHMLKLYTRLMSKKQEEIVAMRKRYVMGLEKLELAAEQVERMKATLTILKPQLELSAKQTMNTMKEVENENVIVERATILVKQEEEVANRKAEIAGALKTECETELAVAIPILEDAVMALNTLKPTDITLVKAMKNPPDTIKLVMAAVCVMLGVLPDRTIDPVTGKKFTDFWGPSKRILGDMNFLQNLKDYDKDDIAPTVMQVIKKTYMTDSSFTPHIVAKASSAAEGLCKWVRAMVSYDEVAKVVAPKKKKLVEAQMECDEAEAFLNEKRQTLAALNAKLAALNDSLRQTLQKKLNLETEVTTCTAKLMKAEKLIASLGGEKSRWMKCVHDLQMNYNNLVGDMLLSCGIIAYMASYNSSFRDEMLSKWKEFIDTSEIPYTKTYDFINVLGVEIEINHWQLCGLSKNRFAIENAIILNNSEQWCLFIDSQNQINQWIKRIEKKNYLNVVKLTDSNYMSIIERNIETGVPVLLENVGERLEIALEPILLKNIYKNKTTWYIDIGAKSVKYSRNFRFYITTRLSNPDYTADVFSKVTVIDFSMPDRILRDKLLDIVVAKERPELQEKFKALRIEDAANKKVLQQQEENILSTLSSTTTNIVEDESAIQILDSSKTLTMSIMKKQEATRSMTEDINKFRDAYLQFADHCTSLFWTLNTLSNLNHMYRFSFSWFIQLYVTSIEMSNRSIVLEKRLQFLKSSFTRNLHSSVCRSLFEKHKLLYSFLLCVKILMDARQTTREEVEFFVSSDARDSDAISAESTPEWLSTDKWRQICKLKDTVSELSELANDFRSNGAAWQKYYNAIPFQSHPMPKPWADRMTPFQRLILVKIIRRDKIIAEIMRLVEDIMLEDVFNSYPHLQISESFAESSCLTPIIFILPSYASSLSFVSAYARARGYTSKFISLSMGDESRQNTADILVEKTRKEGGWIFLQNCHHAVSWIPRLERICENLNLSGTSLDFRLWLSSCSIPDFPISILQNSLKIAYDYPLRLKQSLLRTYRSEPIRSKEFFEGCPGRDKEFSKLLYGLCLFHVIVRERRHFGPQGWNVPYDFDHADFEMSVKQLRDLINENNDIPFDTLLYLVGECNYGGKIVDGLDQRCLEYLLNSFCNTRVIDDREYSFSNCTEHSIPQRCEYRDIIKHINDMQLDASPEAFASDENALVTKDDAIAREFLDSVSYLDQIKSPKYEIAATQDRVSRAIDEINGKLPALFNLDEIRDRYPLVSREPLNAILIHEAELINEIFTAISDSSNNLKSALNGEIILTDSLEDLSAEIYENRVPRVWRSINGDDIVTRNLPNYIELLLKRASFVQNWLDADLPRVIHLDALSCCKRLLSAILLAFSRRRDVPVERTTLDLRVLKDDDPKDDDEDAYYIHGLRLSGARWDARRRILIESSTAGVFYEMPPIRLTFNEEERAVSDKIYECPVYVSPITRNETRDYVTSVPLATDKSHVHWMTRGAALFCQVDE